MHALCSIAVLPWKSGPNPHTWAHEEPSIFVQLLYRSLDDLSVNLSSHGFVGEVAQASGTLPVQVPSSQTGHCQNELELGQKPQNRWKHQLAVSHHVDRSWAVEHGCLYWNKRNHSISSNLSFFFFPKDVWVKMTLLRTRILFKAPTYLSHSACINFECCQINLINQQSNIDLYLFLPQLLKTNSAMRFSLLNFMTDRNDTNF